MTGKHFVHPAVTEQVKRGDNDGVGESDFVSIQVGTGKHGLSRLLSIFTRGISAFVNFLQPS